MLRITNHPDPFVAKMGARIEESASLLLTWDSYSGLILYSPVAKRATLFPCTEKNLYRELVGILFDVGMIELLLKKS